LITTSSEKRKPRLRLGSSLDSTSKSAAKSVLTNIYHRHKPCAYSEESPIFGFGKWKMDWFGDFKLNLIRNQWINKYHRCLQSSTPIMPSFRWRRNHQGKDRAWIRKIPNKISSMQLEPEFGSVSALWLIDWIDKAVLLFSQLRTH
jgi:hypothetical protein